LGVLAVDDPRDGLRPDQGIIEIIEIFANQAALAIENAQLYQAAERRAARLLALHRVVERAGYVTDHTRVWQTVADSLLAEMDVDLCLVALQEGERFAVRGRAGSLRPEIDVDSLFTAADHGGAAPDSTRFDPVLVLNTKEGGWTQDAVVIATGVSSFINAPILSQGRPAGVLFVGAQRTPSPFVEEDLELFIILANQLGSAYESARLQADIRQRAAQLTALAEASQGITATLRTEDVVQAVLAPNGLQRVIPYDSLTVWLREGEQLRVAAAQGFENDAERLGLKVDIADSALFAEMARTRDAIRVPDVRADPRFPAGSLQPTRSWLGAPLVSKGQIIGALALDKIEPHAYSAQAAQVLLAFANQTAVALDNARLFEESEQRAGELDERSRRLALLNRVSGLLGSTLEVERLLHLAMSEVMSTLNVEHALAVTFDLHGRAALAAQIPEMLPPDADPLNPALVRVYESLAPLAVEDTAQDATLAPGTAREALLARGVKSLLVVPLVVAGTPVAAIQFEETTATRRFTPSEIELAQTLANQAAVAVQNARQYDETQVRLNELATLNQISRALSATIDMEQVYQTISEQVRAVLHVDSIYLALYDEAHNQLSFPLRLERGQPLPAEPQTPTGLHRHILWTRAPLLLRGEDVEARLKELGLERQGGENFKSYLGVPLILGERVVGVLAAQDLERPNVFTYEEVRILTTIAAQVAVAVEHARLYAEVQARARELSQRSERLAFLNRLSATLSASLDLEAILRSAAEEVARLFQVDHSGVVLFDASGEFGTVEAEHPEHGLVGISVPLRGDPLEEEMIARRAPVVVPDTASDARLSPALREHFAHLGIQSILIAPLVSQGRVIGSISLDAMSAPRQFTSDESELCQTIAAQVAVAMTNAQFAEDLEARVGERTLALSRERERVETLLQITTELSSSLDLDLVLTRALQLVTDAVNAPRASIFLVDLETDRLIYRAALGRSKPLPPGGEPAPFKRTEGLVGWVIKHRQAVVIGNLETDPRWKQLPGHGSRHKSALAVPLMANEDALGAMILLSPYVNAFDDDQLRLVAAAANQVGAAINNAELYRLIRDQAERLGGMLRGQQVEATKSRAILEGIADGVLVADDEGQVILFNAACERVLGLSRDDALGRPVTEFVGLYGAAGRSLIQAIDRWSADPTTYRPGEFIAQRLELEDKRVILVHLAPVTTSDEYLGSVSVIRDITREVEVDRLKSEFVTNVSHELRTPMTSIKGYADILLMGAAGPLTSEQSKFLEVIKNNADRLSTLVNDLLDISRIESGRVELVMRPLDLGEIFGLVADTLRGRMDEADKKLTVATDVPADLPPVWGDRERVTQVVMNLADNAFNYTHAGGRITLRARRDEARPEVRVEVADTGIGVAPEDQPRLFDRFYRGEDALVLATAGTGLGLPIARQLMEMHGGRLWLAHSEAGQGSTFALTLPLAEREKAASDG
jgi:PAS domain S-box-containing protein